MKKIHTLLFIVSFKIFSQEAITLDFDTYFSYYKDRNIEYKRAFANYENALLDYKSRYSFLYPSLDLSLGTGNMGASFVTKDSSGYSLGTYPYSLNPTLNTNLSFGLQINSLFDQKSPTYNLDFKKKSFLEAERKLKKDAIKNYYNIVFLKEKLDFTEKQIEKNEADFEKLKTEYNTGQKPYSVFLKSQISLRNNKANFESQKIDFKRQFNIFLQEIGLQDIQVVNDIDDRLKTIANEISKWSFLNSDAFLSFQKANLELKILKQNRTNAILELYVPVIKFSLGLSGGFGWNLSYSNSNKEYQKAIFVPNLSISSAFSISFDFSEMIFLAKKRVNLKKIDTEIDLKIQENRKLEEQIANEQLKTKEDVQKLIKDLDFQQQNIEMQQKIVGFYIEDYKKGAIKLDELNTEENLLRQMNLNLMDTKKNIIISYAEYKSLLN